MWMVTVELCSCRSVRISDHELSPTYCIVPLLNCPGSANQKEEVRRHRCGSQSPAEPDCYPCSLRQCQLRGSTANHGLQWQEPRVACVGLSYAGIMACRSIMISTELRSYTVCPPTSAAPECCPINAILYTTSFYVQRNRVGQESSLKLGATCLAIIASECT